MNAHQDWYENTDPGPLSDVGQMESVLTTENK